MMADGNAAERAVLSGVLLAPDTLAAVTELPLEPKHFYADKHAIVFEAMLELFAAGEPIDSVTLREKLDAAGKLGRVGGDEFLLGLTDIIPTLANIRAHAEIVRERAALRKVEHELKGGLRAIETGNLEDAKEAARRAFEVQARNGGPAPYLSTEQIFEPMAPIPWLCEELQLAPGRCNIVGAHGGTGKTFAAQWLALCCAAGRPFGTWFVRRGKVLHVDCDQGIGATRRRYQRLARGMGIDAADLGDRLQLRARRIRLDDATSEAFVTADQLAREFQGADLVIIDSLRAIAPKIDENSSEIRAVIDVLTDVSERTGATIVLIHHARKLQTDQKRGDDDPMMMFRGSSAIANAAGCMYAMAAVSDEPGALIKVVHAKASADAGRPKRAPFWVGLEDVDVDGDARGGVRLVVHESEPGGESADEGTFDQDAERILRTAREHPGLPRTSLAIRARGNRKRMLETIDALADEGKLAKLPGAKPKTWVYRVEVQQ